MFVIQKDVFLITLVRDVSKWYDQWYKGNVIAMKALHLGKLLENYDPDRFKNCDNLYKERITFLSEIQEIMEGQNNIGGSGVWMF